MTQFLSAYFTYIFVSLFIFSKFQFNQVFELEFVRFSFPFDSSIVSCTSIGADHSRFLRLLFTCLDSSCSLTILKFFLSVLRHPKACLNPLLFGNLTHHSKLLTLHTWDHLGIGLILSIQLLHLLALLSLIGLCNAHLNSVELFNLLHYFILLFLSVTDLLAASLYFVKFSHS